MTDDNKLSTAYGTGIAGTVLGAVALASVWGGLGGFGFNGDGCGNGNGNGWGLFGNRANACGNNNVIRQDTREIGYLESQVAELKSMRYTDQVGLELYQAIIRESNANDAKLTQAVASIYDHVINLEKESALTKQAVAYENTILSNKIDCCCDKTRMMIDHNQQLNCLADASIISYVNSNFLPGTLYLPAASITPPVTTTAA